MKRASSLGALRGRQPTPSRTPTQNSYLQAAMLRAAQRGELPASFPPSPSRRPCRMCRAMLPPAGREAQGCFPASRAEVEVRPQSGTSPPPSFAVCTLFVHGGEMSPVSSGVFPEVSAFCCPAAALSIAIRAKWNVLRTSEHQSLPCVFQIASFSFFVCVCVVNFVLWIASSCFLLLFAS